MMKKPIIWFLFFITGLVFKAYPETIQLTCNDTLTLYATITNESCFGNDGVIYVEVIGGDSPYSYSSIFFNSTVDSNIFVIDSLSAGFYDIVVNDTNNCSDTININLIADNTPQINLNVESTNIVCYGDSNGTFKVVDPDSAYLYVLYRYTLLTPQTIIDTGYYFNGLIEGYYGVIAISPSGNCIDSSIILFIDEPEPIVFNTPLTSAVYCLDSDTCQGFVTMNGVPSGGISPYQYYLNELFVNIPQGLITINDTFPSLCPGYYEIQVLDANACVYRDTVVIADSSLYIDSFNVTNVSCFGSSDGQAHVFVQGGVSFGSNYSYMWENGSSNEIANNLLSGYHTVVITDQQGCTLIDSVLVLSPDSLTFKIVENGKIPETCMGVSFDGQIILEINGGTPPYYHSWIGNSGLNGGGFGDTLINLSFDTITISIYDINGCFGEPAWGNIDQTIVPALNSSSQLSLDTVLLANDTICHNALSGIMEIVINSGEAPYQYSIDNGITLTYVNIFYNLAGLNYNIVVYDAFGCTDSSQVTIGEFPEIVISIDSLKHVNCYEGEDGFIDISISGGVPPYSYLWSPTYDTTASIDNLSARSYSVQITDSMGCMIADTIALIELSNPLQSSDIVTHANCFGASDGSALIHVNGGNPNSLGLYDFLWIDSSIDTVANSAYVEGLSAGIYLVYITDSFGCGPLIDTVVILEPDSFYLEIVNITDNLCFNGSSGEILINTFGGTEPYLDYFISDFSDFHYVENNALYDSLYSATYNVWVIDNNGCFSDTISNIKLGEPGRVKIDQAVSHLNCYESSDGFIDLVFSSGVPPYFYELYSSQQLMQTGNSHAEKIISIYDLQADNYTLSVRDYNGCEFDTLIIVEQPADVISSFQSGLVLGRESLTTSFVNLSSGADLFMWDYGDGFSEFTFFNDEVKHTFLEQGQYNVMLIASNSNLNLECSDTSFVIIDVEGYDLFNIFSPNQDGINDFFHFNDWMLQGLYVEIFNRWGQKVFSWDQVNGAWNGEGFNGERLPEGVYFYIMDAIGVDGYNFTEKGSITLIR